MKRLSETVGFLMVLFGAAGIMHHFFGWFRLWGVLRHLGLFRDHAIAANAALIVVGGIVLVLADHLPKPVR
jgi:hypothetical protein